MHPASVQPLPLKSGALQGALVIEYPLEHRFQTLHIVYDGVNGQLPNLDLFNTAVSIAGGQMGIGANLQEMWNHDDSYENRLQTMVRGMTKQGLGYATGAHSSFMPYHIDAITLQTKGEGWEDEMALGRTIESLCRSLNNLLEHLHQSFFFYLLMQSNRFVSIGTYLPSAMLLAGNFTIMAIALWMRTGYYPETKSVQTKGEKAPAEEKAKTSNIAERKLALPLSLVVGLHLLGLVPLWVFNNVSHQVSLPKGPPRMTRVSLTKLVLHHDYIRCTWRGYHSPVISRRNPVKWSGSIKATHPPTIPPYQIILPPPPRPLPLNPCHPQLLSFIHDWSALHATQLHDPSAGGCACPSCYLRSRLGPSQSSLPADCPPRRLLVHRRLG